MGPERICPWNIQSRHDATILPRRTAFLEMPKGPAVMRRALEMQPVLGGGLFDGNRLREVAWLIHVRPFEDSHVIGEELQRDNRQ